MKTRMPYRHHMNPIPAAWAVFVISNSFLAIPAMCVGSDFDWWSYQAIQRPPVPELNSAWVRTPVDAFVLDTLREKGLTPSPEADRRTLIRRLTFDLIGLPPTPAEVEAFVNDTEPAAYEKLVDRLLRSDHYGERWARHWLDVVKYADTCGYDKDKLRSNAWPYRDYVIRSFNDDKPYNRFVQEQVAGDVLFPGEPDGVLGLGFIAAGPWDFIGHAEVSEAKIDGKVARNLDRDDMVSNTLNTFCSVTVQCARCHDHKFDPITQEHYYGLQAIFAAVDRAERPYRDVDKETLEQRQRLTDRLDSLRNELDVLQDELAAAGGARLAELNQQIADLKAKLAIDEPATRGYHSQIANSFDVEKWVEVELVEAASLSKIVLYPCYDEFAGIGAGFGFPLRFRVEISIDGEHWDSVSDETEADYPNPGLRTHEIVVSGTAARIRITAEKLVERRDDYIFALAEVQVLDSAGRNLAQGAKVTSHDSIEAPPSWARANLTNGVWPGYRDADLGELWIAAVDQRRQLLAEIETPERTKRRESLRNSLEQTQKQMSELPQGQMVYAAATHFKPEGEFKPTEGTLRPIHVLGRGDIQNALHPATPGVMPLDEDARWQIDPALTEGDRRAALARWLTRPDQPLVWRSIVNRIWQYHFGAGIVETPNDFGRMGAEPTHPELLDWLAIEFRDGGQSMKMLHRMIVTSSVYRQTSEFNAVNARLDGSNQYLWRMNRRRLEAEEIRDSILSVSGALSPEMGGPGYYLFELETTDHSPHYEYHKFDPSDPASHRRSIYQFIVRSQPNPFMTTLDCADSSQSTPRRNETLTSLQALSLLNNKFNLVMAERFAERLRAECAGPDEQVDRAMRLATQRAPTDEQQKVLIDYAQSHGMANLCRFLFNLSEFVFVD